MPYWSTTEWRARIGSSWSALGRPFKTRSPFRGKVQKALTLSQGTTTMLLLIISIGVNLGLRALVAGGHHLPLLNFFGGGTVPHRMYLINLGLILTLIIQIISALVYRLLSMAINSSKGFSGDLIESLSFGSCFVYYSIFLILKMTNPSMYPLHWLMLLVINMMDCLISLSVLWKTVANKQGLVEKLDYFDADVEVVIMTRREGTWVLAVAKAVLDVVLSVAASVVLSLLLISGDVERNPGPPGDINYDIIDTTELTKGDLSKIIAELLTIQSRYYYLGRSLNLEIADLRKIRDSNPIESDGLEDVLLLWLGQHYDVNQHGPPTWRKLVEAVNDVGGGNNCELAKQIASNHPAVATAGAKQSTCSSTETAFPSLKEILGLTWNYRARWRFIGIELGIDEGTLDAINENNRKVEDCLREMMTLRLRHKPKLSLHAITTALQSGRVSSTVGYTASLKSFYKAKTQVCTIDDDQWPPPVMNRVFRLAMIMAEELERTSIRDDFVRETITGKVDDILKKKVPIKLEDIFQENIKKGKQRKVLIEGVPGCGKSTLALHICQQWAEGKLFQEYRQIVLVRLREQAVQNAKNIADILPQGNTIGREIEEELKACNGQDVLFIFDGWDELPITAPGRSVIISILDNTQLCDSSVIITSRPTSSADLHRIVNSRIEILGFTEDELQQYFAECLENNIKNVETLQQRIQENPVVAGSCYLPLNASILVHLFKFAEELPNTQFGIFSSLICNCMHRHLRKSTKHKISGITSLEDLPQIIQGPFQDVCKIAYEGVMEDRIIFDLDYNFNTLGLLQGVESFTGCGTSHSYNFLHLSIQELLAAFHMATKLRPSEQVEQFKQLFGRARFAAVFQFYAAKTKLKTHGIQKVVVKAANKCLANPEITELSPQDAAQNHSVFKKLKDVVVEAVKKRLGNPTQEQDYTTQDTAQNHSTSKYVKPQPLILSLLHCIYEAQDKALCELVVQQFKDSKLNLNGISLNPADCLAVGYFLTHCKQFEVNLGSCSIRDDGCKTLFREGAVYDLRILYLEDNSIGDEGAKVLSEAIKTMGNLQGLSLRWNSIGDEGVKLLSDAIKTTGNLQWLDLYKNSIGDEGAKVLSDAIKTTGNLQGLHLDGNSIGDEEAKVLADAIKTMGNLQVLSFDHSAIGDVGREALEEAAAVTVKQQSYSSTSGQEALLGVWKLPGVDECSETSVVISSSQGQLVDWNGLKLHVHVGSLPEGIDQCTICIKASLAGVYEIPENSSLVSAIFWLRCEPQCTFTKPITVEIQHCSTKQDLSRLKIIRAYCNQKQLPYKFKPLGGRFNADASYGAIEVNSFSGVGVIEENPGSERMYYSQLFYRSFYSHQQRHDIHITFTWNTAPHINYVAEKYPEQQGFLAGCYQVVELDGDVIKVCLERAQWTKVMDNQWEIQPAKSTVTKAELDVFKIGRGIPNCVLEARPLCEQFPQLLLDITLSGIKPPYNKLTLSYMPSRKDPPSDAMQQPQAVQPQLAVCPPTPLVFSEDLSYEQLPVWLTNHPKLVGVGYQQDISKLKDARVNGCAFLSLDESILRQFRVSFGFQVTVMSIIEKLKSNQKPPEGERLPSQNQQSPASSATPPTTWDQPTTSAAYKKINLDELPKLDELLILKYMDKGEKKKLRIISEASHKWMDIANLICSDANVTSVLEQKHLSDPNKCLKQTFISYFISKKPQKYTQDWNGLIKLLDDVDLEILAENVKQALPYVCT